MEEKHIVIVIPSYNNSKWYQRNLLSVASQEYDNFSIIYVDDCSPDGTVGLVEDFLKERELEERCSLIKNAERLGALKNLYDAIHSCHEDDIILTLDGDDWLANNQVLQTVNKYYSDPNVWITWGSYIDHPHGSRGCSKPIHSQIIDNQSYRRSPWCTSHLRTFYKWLFAKIKLEDFLAPDGTFWNSAWDLSFMIPMIELAGHHGKYMNEITYIYNNENPIQDYKIRLNEQQNFEKLIRGKQKYEKL